MTTTVKVCNRIFLSFRFEETIMSKKRISEEVQYLKEVLGKLQSPVVFAHNDLLLGNVIYTEEKGTVNFIDFEYAAPNYQAFDIANHFAEFAGNYFNQHKFIFHNHYIS